jgi:ADP-heptose:LPS heptosyltransferase
MSLPRIFSTRLDSIPDRGPYLHADPTRSAAWSAQLAPDHRLKIGLAWAGSANHKHDRYRSMPLSAFAPLAKIPGTVFYSLQIGSAAEQAKSPPDGMNLIDRTSTLHDLADTAALIANLDLVISVDTAVAHLAGALAQPVWTLLAFEPDWRWLLNRSDSPWYPTMRLFRQPAIGDWATVMDQVASALRQALAERTSPR